MNLRLANLVPFVNLNGNVRGFIFNLSLDFSSVHATLADVFTRGIVRAKIIIQNRYEVPVAANAIRNCRVGQ